MPETISGVIDRITYFNDDNGYCVVNIVPEMHLPMAQGHDGTVTVVGTMPAFREGESVQFTGEWDNNRRYGMQFKASAAVFHLPRTEEEIFKYLSSSAVKGIGPGSAAQLVDHFGEATIEILDEEPHRVYGIPGLKSAVVDRFLKDWHDNHVQRLTLIYLQANLGSNARLARRIYSKYGVVTRRVIRTDPYRLAVDEFVRFERADEIARKLGVAEGHSGRLRAGLLQALNEFASNGHTFAPRSEALARAARLLRWEDERALERALRDLLDEKRVKEERFVGEDGAELIRAVYLSRFWRAENEVVETLSAIVVRRSHIIDRERDEDSLGIILKHFHEEGIDRPAPEQIGAVQSALSNKVSVLTGGPGTGKTATLRIVASVLRDSGYDFKLAAPTGRAARRLYDATGVDASTIHRLLRWNPESGDFTHHEGNPIRTDVIVIDEASMLDLLLFNHLLQAMPLSAHLLLVGDVNQLPSVGAGNVLGDVINSGIAKVTRLQQVHRQDDKSHIVSNAHLINRGEVLNTDNQSKDFFFFELGDPELVASEIVKIVKSKAPDRWGVNPLLDIQVIAPMRPGIIGVDNFNKRLQAELNGDSAASVKSGSRVFRVGDKVMQTRNNYDKDVYNGDIGFIQSINTADKSLKINFNYGHHGKSVELSTDVSEENDLEGFFVPQSDTGLRTYQFSELDNLTLAYCITVHKSQGSEFPVVVMPIHSQQSRMLQRNLLYTAITRAKQGVILVGTRKALKQAVDNIDITDRYSGLLHRLRA